MTTTTFYTIDEIYSQAPAGATLQRYTAIAMPSQDSIAEGYDAIDKQNLITVETVLGDSSVYIQYGSLGWVKEEATTIKEFCDGEYSGDEWESYTLSEMDRF